MLKEETLLIPGGKCTDDVQMIGQPVAPEEWFNGYQVEVVQTANPKNRTANAPVLLIAK